MAHDKGNCTIPGLWRSIPGVANLSQPARFGGRSFISKTHTCENLVLVLGQIASETMMATPTRR